VRYLLILGVLTAASLCAVPFWLLLSPEDMQAVLINALWSLFNLLLVAAACLVAFEQPQLRQAHRLPRKLTAIIHSNKQSWTGTTENISETGARILLTEWPNIPDELKIELIGDYGARVLLDGRVVRAVATNKLEMRLNVEFVNLTRTQQDDLVVVIYSDVQEWYSQKRTQVDNPISSLKFIATSFKRVYQEFRPEVGVKVRKKVEATAQVFWDGWLQPSYQARVTEIGMREIRIEVEHCLWMDWDVLQEAKPLLSLLVYGNTPETQAQSLLAKVENVEVLFSPSLETSPIVTAEEIVGHVAIELTFPESLNAQQRGKIREVLRSLNA
jgi:cellulose synthase (UDP-forming)